MAIKQIRTQHVFTGCSRPKVSLEKVATVLKKKKRTNRDKWTPTGLQTNAKRTSTNKAWKQEHEHKEGKKYVNMAQCVQRVESRSFAKREISGGHSG